MHYGLGRDSYLYGIGVCQAPSSRFPVNEDVFSIHSRGVDCQYEAVFTQSGIGRDSYLHGMGFSQVSSSSVPVKDDVFPIHRRSVESGADSTKLYLHNLVSVAIRICIVQGFPMYYQAGYPSTVSCLFNASPQRVQNGVVSTKPYLQTLVLVALCMCMV